MALSGAYNGVARQPMARQAAGRLQARYTPEMPMTDLPSPSTSSPPGTNEFVAGCLARFGSMVKRSAWRITRDEHLAEDVCQVVFLVLARKGPGMCFRSLGGWLHRVAIQVAQSVVRTETRRKRREEKVAIRATATTDTVASLPAGIDEAIDRLPEKYRQVIVSHYLQGQDYPEVAAELGISEETARKRSSLAVARLREALAPSSAAFTLPVLAQALTAESVVAGSSALAPGTVAAIQAAIAGGAASHIAALAQSTLAALFWHKVQTVTLWCVLSALLVAGGSLIAIRLARQPEPPTPVAASTTVAAKAPVILFEDDFESRTLSRWGLPAEHAWRITAHPDGKGAVLAGGTFANARNDPWPRRVMLRTQTALRCGDPSWTDYAVEVSVRFQQDLGPARRTSGVVIFARIQKEDDVSLLEKGAYLLDLAFADQAPYMAIRKRVDGRETLIVAESVLDKDNPPAKPQLGKWYRLRFEVRGNHLRGLLNDKLVVQAQDTDLKSGTAALGRRDVALSDAEVYWDDVIVQGLTGN